MAEGLRQLVQRVEERAAICPEQLHSLELTLRPATSSQGVVPHLMHVGEGGSQAVHKASQPLPAQVVSGGEGPAVQIGAIEFAEASMTRQFVTETLSRGVVVNWTLNADRVVRLAPPLTIAEDEIDFAVTTMEEALTAARKRLSVQ